MVQYAYTRAIFKSDSIVRRTISDGLDGLFAAKDIESGELLLVEHMAFGTPFQLTNTISVNKALFDTLAPRTIALDEDNIGNNEQNEMAARKVQSNSFAATTDKQFLCLGSDISMFNHRCNSNCAHYQLLIRVPGLGSEVVVGMVWACERVAAGTQLTIQYGSRHGHGVDTYKCDCGIEDVNKRSKLMSTKRMLCERWKSKCFPMLNSYFLSAECEATILLSELIPQRIYFNGNTVLFDQVPGVKKLVVDTDAKVKNAVKMLYLE